MTTWADIRQNLLRLQEKVSETAAGVQRDPGEISLVGVTKRKSAEVVRAAIEAGILDIGENRIQEVRDKFPAIDFGSTRRHFVGHLQSNKVKYLPGLVDILQSLDSRKLADRLQQHYAVLGERLPVFLQVNISGEASKSGVSPDELAEFTGYCLELKALDVQGFMTIGPLTTDRSEIRNAFQWMYRLVEDRRREYSDELGSASLSMGMSGDFDIGIEEGATHIRVGTALFGPRE